MSDLAIVTRSLRSSRLYARVPRVIAALLAVIFMVAGVRAAFSPAQKAAAARVAPVVSSDTGAASFAEGFARAYLTWDANRPDDRTERLVPYLGAIDDDAGLQPARHTSQGVLWTSVIGERREAQARLVTVAVQTTRRLLYVSVPVSRDDRGFLSINAYPAIVGPPAADSEGQAPQEDAVEDDALIAVANRTMRNYLADNRQNLLADLTPDALVSPPSDALTVTDNKPHITWVVPARRIAVELDVRDSAGTGLKLRYELDVRKRERWYVRSIQVDPTFREGR